MDIGNALFNWVAAGFVVLNALDIWKRKDVAGHTYPSAIFFTLWAGFSIFYFAGLQQWWTIWPTAAMFAANGFLLVLVFTYRRKFRQSIILGGIRHESMTDEEFHNDRYA
ncbi:hypothetical protein [Mesorhizobium sp. M8A.F.Ca.ET.021.01.1.1]|uniref:hypothetical protein n=1 Tax=Mesorhizobium sp. M8A.F.Ca.ET.021.01.1.1 TaxID=2496757 RepID=UPI000FCBAC59|nr:hypothetical protein [Mesorhizobium sp. M8A.F.Ca.ET.021.01.1.1]RUW57142.1 hypothetical protein EOA36_00735 [Mesorhizobium sp. M8A.F.Ca.ET.021.01.1.1]